MCALAGALGACGGGVTPRLSAAEFIEGANDVCRTVDERLAEKGKGLFDQNPNDATAPSADKLITFFTDIALPGAREKLDRIDDLRPPVDKESAVGEMLDSGREAVDEVAAAFEEDPEAALSDTGPDPFEDFNTQADELGLGACAGEAVDPASTDSTPGTPSTFTTDTNG